MYSEGPKAEPSQLMDDVGTVHASAYTCNTVILLPAARFSYVFGDSFEVPCSLRSARNLGCHADEPVRAMIASTIRVECDVWIGCIHDASNTPPSGSQAGCVGKWCHGVESSIFRGLRIRVAG